MYAHLLEIGLSLATILRDWLRGNACTAIGCLEFELALLSSACCRLHLPTAAIGFPALFSSACCRLHLPTAAIGFRLAAWNLRLLFSVERSKSKTNVFKGNTMQSNVLRSSDVITAVTRCRV